MDKVKLNLVYHADGRTYLNGTLVPLSITGSFINVDVRPSEAGPYIEYFIKLANFNDPFQRPWGGSYHYTLEFTETKVTVSLLALLDDADESYRFVSEIDFSVLEEHYEKLIEEYGCEESIDTFLEDWIIIGPIALKRTLSESCSRCL